MGKIEENKVEEFKAHCLIFPYPVQGHINPMLQFSKRLLHKKIRITLVVTKHLSKTTLFSSDSISVETISDGYDDGPPLNPGTYLTKFKEVGSKNLKEVIERLAGSGRPVDCIVFDPFLPWAMTVAKELGVLAAAFFTQSCAVDHIYHHVYKGELKIPLAGDEDNILIPGLPPLRPEDLPSFITDCESYPATFDLFVNHQFKGLEKADWVFFNTFYKLEHEVIDYMKNSTAQVKEIGPTIPSVYLDKRLANDNEYGFSLFKPVVGDCMKWLDEQRTESVVYVSFGSLAQLGDKQMEELAWGLKLSNKNFLWVVRKTEQSKLPKDFAKETSEKGLILPWCPQLDVLSHKAICCFVTHSGWNSTLEALCLGVPMVAMPHCSDQTTNAKFVMDVWKTGTRAIVDDDGVVSRETITSCIREVVEGEREEEIKKNVTKWKELARESMVGGGSSDLNIEEFVSSLRSNYQFGLNRVNLAQFKSYCPEIASQKS